MTEKKYSVNELEILLSGERVSPEMAEYSQKLREHIDDQELIQALELFDAIDDQRIRESEASHVKVDQQFRAIKSRIHEDNTYNHAFKNIRTGGIRHMFETVKGCVYIVFEACLLKKKALKDKYSEFYDTLLRTQDGNLSKSQQLTDAQREKLAKLMLQAREFKLQEHHYQILSRVRFVLGVIAVALVSPLFVIIANKLLTESDPYKPEPFDLARSHTIDQIANNGGIYNINEETQIAIQYESNMSYVNHKTVELGSGSIWLDVEPGGEGFTVLTPQGPVSVMGTSFGVTLDGDNLHVDVSEGKVKVGKKGAWGTVEAGLQLMKSKNQEPIIDFRPDVYKKPSWTEFAAVRQSVFDMPELVGYWNMEPSLLNGSVGVVDLSSHGHHATPGVYGSPQYDVPSKNETLFGDAVYFSREQRANLEIQNTSTLSKLTKNFTVACWVKIDPENRGWVRLVSCRNGGWRFGFQQFVPSLGWHLNYSLKEFHSVQPNNFVLPTDEWTHVALTMNASGNQISFYVNGRLIQRRHVSRQIEEARSTWQIGINSLGTDTFEQNPDEEKFFKGSIDELYIFNKALSEPEILMLSGVGMLEQ